MFEKKKETWGTIHLSALKWDQFAKNTPEEKRRDSENKTGKMVIVAGNQGSGRGFFILSSLLYVCFKISIKEIKEKREEYKTYISGKFEES